MPDKTNGLFEMEMSHLEVLRIWFLSDAPNPLSSWDSLSPTWDQVQWQPRPWLSDTRNRAQHTSLKCSHGPKRSLPLKKAVLPPFHGGGTSAGCYKETEGSYQAGVHLKKSCYRERVFGENTLIFYHVRCIHGACEGIWTLSGPTV